MSEVASNADEFRRTVAKKIVEFESAALVRRVEESTATLAHYHSILATLFHQTQSGPYTFAEAAVHCSWRHAGAKEYLLRHAEEERTHWRWVLDDLRSTGYAGVSPESTLPHATCESYISFNQRVARSAPVARLAIACVLEGIGGQLGEKYGRKLLESVGLKREQATFFLSHGETDKVHMQELADVIAECDLSAEEWGWMTHAASVGGQLYRAMYDHESFQ